MRRLAAVLLLAACSAGEPAPPSAMTFVPDAQGLAVPETGQRVDFGRAPDGVIAALDRELGPHRALDLAGCPNGVEAQLAWGALALSFTRERFVGWRNGGSAAGQVCA